MNCLSCNWERPLWKFKSNFLCADCLCAIIYNKKLLGIEIVDARETFD